MTSSDINGAPFCAQPQAEALRITLVSCTPGRLGLAEKSGTSLPFLTSMETLALVVFRLA